MSLLYPGSLGRTEGAGGYFDYELELDRESTSASLGETKREGESLRAPKPPYPFITWISVPFFFFTEKFSEVEFWHFLVGG